MPNIENGNKFYMNQGQQLCANLTKLTPLQFQVTPFKHMY